MHPPERQHDPPVRIRREARVCVFTPPTVRYLHCPVVCVTCGVSRNRRPLPSRQSQRHHVKRPVALGGAPARADPAAWRPARDAAAEKTASAGCEALVLSKLMQPKPRQLCGEAHSNLLHRGLCASGSRSASELSGLDMRYWSVVTTAVGQEPSVAAACRDAPAVCASYFPQGSRTPKSECGSGGGRISGAQAAQPMGPGRWWTGTAAWVGPSPQDRVRSHSCRATHAVVRPVTKWS